jgi:hypothetical protein
MNKMAGLSGRVLTWHVQRPKFNLQHYKGLEQIFFKISHTNGEWYMKKILSINISQ